MKNFSSLYRFSTKIAILKEYLVPALDPAKTKNNLIWLHGMFDNSKNFFQIS